ncbi:hypothetical protein SAZ11_53040 [Streptomyces sp. FXJ1.4098]|nr:hypothetical protein [Streptomyces sp. FXJ1.4098]
MRDDGGLEHLGRVASHADAEAVLRGHPSVGECLVTTVEFGKGRKTLIAYVTAVEGAEVDWNELRLFLSTRLPSARAPQTLAGWPHCPERAPARSTGAAFRCRRSATPHGARRAGRGACRSTEVKGRHMERHRGDHGTLLLPVLDSHRRSVAVFDRSVAGSPALAALFTGLYVCESLAFGLGMGFLFCARPLVARHGRSPVLTSAAHLAVAWLLIAWWPQDNYYRLAAKTDWARQAALVYVFNVTLMIAGAVLVAFVAAKPRKTDPTR